MMIKEISMTAGLGLLAAGCKPPAGQTQAEGDSAVKAGSRSRSSELTLADLPTPKLFPGSSRCNTRGMRLTDSGADGTSTDAGAISEFEQIAMSSEDSDFTRAPGEPSDALGLRRSRSGRGKSTKARCAPKMKKIHAERFKGTTYWNKRVSPDSPDLPAPFNDSSFLATATGAGVPEQAFLAMGLMWKKAAKLIRNKKYATIIDYSQSASAKRLYVLDLRNKSVKGYQTAHGACSEWAPKIAEYFSNRGGTNASTLGFLLTGGNYTGYFGKSMLLHGLERRNSATCKRTIVMHPWGEGNSRGKKPTDPTEGCPTASPGNTHLITDLAGGSLMLLYHRKAMVQNPPPDPPRRRKR